MPLRSSMSVSCCWWLAKRASFPPLRGSPSVFPSSHTFSTRRENSELDASSSSYSSWAGEEGDDPPPDKIHLNDLQFHAYHGVLPSEKSLGQKFLINVEMKTKRRNTLSAFDTETPTPTSSKTSTEEVLKAHDRIEHTVDYAKAFTLIKSIVVSGPQRDLIETVGEDIAGQILRQFASVDEVKVSVEKPHVAIDGDLRSLGISLVRRRRKP